VESFNGTLRSECLDAHWFATLAEAKQVIEVWRREYNESRPHRALGERTPNEFASEFAGSRELTGQQTADLVDLEPNVICCLNHWRTEFWRETS
jgi:putative transposase